MEPTPPPFAIRLFLGSLFILFLSIILFAKRGSSPQTLGKKVNMSLNTEDILKNERKSLRDELLHLKHCQLQYFVLSISASGLFFAFGAKLGNDSNLVYLSPLIIILPCWFVFFDKAKSITRIVGYYKLVEKALIGKGRFLYCGWENSLTKFRVYQNANKLGLEKLGKNIAKYQLVDMLLLRTPHSYWMINWYTFFGISSLCVGLSFSGAYDCGLFVSIIAAILVAMSAYFNFQAVVRLIYGRSSYTANTRFWRIILRQC